MASPLRGQCRCAPLLRNRSRRFRRTSVEILILHPEDIYRRTQKSPRGAGFDVGWGWRIRTSTYGVRDRCPTIRRIPTCTRITRDPWLQPQPKQESGINVWRTEDAYAPCAGQPSYAPQHVRRESGIQPYAWGFAAPRRTGPGHGQYRDGSHRPVRCYHHP